MALGAHRERVPCGDVRVDGSVTLIGNSGRCLAPEVESAKHGARAVSGLGGQQFRTCFCSRLGQKCEHLGATFVCPRFYAIGSMTDAVLR